MLYAERHRPRGVGLAGAVHCTWAVAEKNDWQFLNPRIDTALHSMSKLFSANLGKLRLSDQVKFIAWQLYGFSAVKVMLDNSLI